MVLAIVFAFVAGLITAVSPCVLPVLPIVLGGGVVDHRRRPSSDLGGGFLLGCALGFVFVPCGGPAIGFVTASAATNDFGSKTIAVAVAYTVGVSLVLLAIAM